MANTKPRRGDRARRAATKATGGKDDAPWAHGDPTRNVFINVRFTEPTILQMEYLIDNKAIFSKAAFIRAAVDAACTREIERFRKVRAYMRQLDDEEKIRHRKK